MPRYITVVGGILVTLTPDRIFNRIDADRAYAARRTEADQIAAGPARLEPDPPQYAAPQLRRQYAQPQQYVQTQQYMPQRYGPSDAPDPATPTGTEDMSQETDARRQASRPPGPRSGAYSQLMASHDRMGTRHLG